MSNFARNIVWGLLGATTTKVARRATRRAMHNPYGSPRLPVEARRRTGLGTALAWAAGTGVALALADVLREQRKEVVKHTPPAPRRRIPARQPVPAAV